jgi:hypothetical protein
MVLLIFSQITVIRLFLIQASGLFFPQGKCIATSKCNEVTNLKHTRLHCVIHKKGLRPSSGEINRLTMMMMMLLLRLYGQGEVIETADRQGLSCHPYNSAVVKAKATLGRKNMVTFS